MSLLFYLPLIVWMGLVEVAQDKMQVPVKGKALDDHRPPPRAESAAARCGVDSHLVFPIDRSPVQFDGQRRTPMIKLIKRYHPERHYMRGPGPKWLEKHSGGIDRIGPVTDDHCGDKHSLTGFFFQLLLGRRA